jgi:hypothetical protein
LERERVQERAQPLERVQVRVRVQPVRWHRRSQAPQLRVSSCHHASIRLMRFSTHLQQHFSNCEFLERQQQK